MKKLTVAVLLLGLVAGVQAEGKDDARFLIFTNGEKVVKIDLKAGEAYSLGSIPGSETMAWIKLESWDPYKVIAIDGVPVTDTEKK